MERTKFEVHKSTLMSFLEGHRKANEFIKAERRKRLSQSSVEDTLREYDDLCNIWEAHAQKEGLEVLERQKISFLLERRRRFNRAGGFGEGK